MTALVAARDDGPVRLVRMNRPDKKNALTAEMYAELALAIENAGQAPQIRCILLAGVPGAFCAGNDLQDFQEAASQKAGLAPTVLHFLYALVRCEKPLIAAVDGVAVGIGTTMLMHCDFVAAGSEARFSTPFAHLGLVPEAGSTLLAPQLMGQRRAFSLLVMGRRIDAQEALSCGLVNVVVAAGEAEAEALKAAHEVAKLPPQAVAKARRLMRGDAAKIIAQIDKEAEVFRDQLQTEEAKAAFQAFFSRKR